MKEVFRPKPREQQIDILKCDDSFIYAFQFQDTIQLLCKNSTPNKNYQWFILSPRWGGFENKYNTIIDALSAIDPTTKIYQFETQQEYLKWAVQILTN